jgi:hypothetical protein
VLAAFRCCQDRQVPGRANAGQVKPKTQLLAIFFPPAHASDFLLTFSPSAVRRPPSLPLSCSTFSPSSSPQRRARDARLNCKGRACEASRLLCLAEPERLHFYSSSAQVCCCSCRSAGTKKLGLGTRAQLRNSLAGRLVRVDSVNLVDLSQPAASFSRKPAVCCGRPPDDKRCVDLPGAATLALIDGPLWLTDLLSFARRHPRIPASPSHSQFSNESGRRARKPTPCSLPPRPQPWPLNRAPRSRSTATSSSTSQQLAMSTAYT